MKTLIVCRATAPHRQAEALRAALGVTLRGAQVEVLVAGPLLSPLAERAAATLTSFGHVVRELTDLSGALRTAAVVEVWT